MNSALWIKKGSTHIFLSEVYQVLQIDVVSVGPNVVVNEKVELVLDPVFEDEGQDSCSQLQEEDDTQEHGELKDVNSHTSFNFTNVIVRRRKKEKSARKYLHNMISDEWTYKFEQERVFSQRSDAPGESEDERHTAHHQEEPDWVKTPEVGDVRDVGEDTLKNKVRG